jgi:hypothetical protein
MVNHKNLQKDMQKIHLPSLGTRSDEKAFAKFFELNKPDK